MGRTIETAIERIRSVGDRLCENQVYCFEDYVYDPEVGAGDATALCHRLGIPVTDEVVIEYPAKSTFSPLPETEINAFEDALGASLPGDYKQLLTTLGPFHLPGSASICLYSPSSAVSASCGAWGFDDPLTMPVLAISQYHQHCDGDSLGFIRKGAQFGDLLYIFHHDLRYLHHGSDDPTRWSERLAESLATFVVSYIEQLA